MGDEYGDELLRSLESEARRLTYEAALNSQHWAELKQKVRERCKGWCEWPGCKNPCQSLHHRHYRTLGEERPQDVLYLCDGHHLAIHERRRSYRSRHKNKR